HAFMRRTCISLMLAGCANDHTSQQDGVTDASSMGSCNPVQWLPLPGTNGYVDGGATVRVGNDAPHPCAMEAPPPATNEDIGKRRLGLVDRFNRAVLPVSMGDRASDCTPQGY